MIIPLMYFLIAYGIFVAIAGFFLFFNLYHILMFGLQGFKTLLVILLYLTTILLVAWLSYELILAYDWTGEILLNEFISSLMPSIL